MCDQSYQARAIIRVLPIGSGVRQDRLTGGCLAIGSFKIDAYLTENHTTFHTLVVECSLTRCVRLRFTTRFRAFSQPGFKRPALNTLRPRQPNQYQRRSTQSTLVLQALRSRYISRSGCRKSWFPSYSHHGADPCSQRSTLDRRSVPSPHHRKPQEAEEEGKAAGKAQQWL